MLLARDQLEQALYALPRDDWQADALGLLIGLAIDVSQATDTQTLQKISARVAELRRALVAGEGAERFPDCTH